MVRDTVSHLTAEGQQVFLDAEHFFDGYRANRDYAFEVLRTAYEAGADVVALCDTNGGMLPDWVSDVVHDVVETTGVRVGIHAHNDSGCAVANSLAAVDAGRVARAGLHQRLRRAHRQRRPGHRGRQPRAQAGPAGAPAGSPGRLHPDRARRGRGDQLPAGLATAVRRGLGVHAQGRPARERDQGRPGPLPAHPAGAGRQRHAAAGLRHGRPRVDRAQGPRARLRPVRGPGAGHRGDRTGQGARVARVHLRGRRRVVRAAPRRDGGGRPAVVLRGGVLAGHHRDPAGRARRSPRRR